MIAMRKMAFIQVETTMGVITRLLRFLGVSYICVHTIFKDQLVSVTNGQSPASSGDGLPIAVSPDSKVMADFIDTLSPKIAFDLPDAPSGDQKSIGRESEDYETTFIAYLNDALDTIDISTPYTGSGPAIEPNGASRIRRRLNVFTPDERQRASQDVMNTYPFRTVGMIVYQDEFCTATLVHANMVVTNRHCLSVNTESNSLPSDFYEKAYFVSGYSNGIEPYKIAFDDAAWTDAVGDTAYLRLIEPIGYYIGWVGIYFTDLSDFQDMDQTFDYIGYSEDIYEEHQTASFVIGCKSRGVTLDGQLNIKHDCDATKGATGSLLLSGLGAQPYAHAINAVSEGQTISGGWNSRKSNYAKPMNLGHDQFLRILNSPTAAPTSFPTPHPSPYPTPFPTPFPTNFPTPNPSSYPTPFPTRYPTSYPSPFPTSYPSPYPTPHPSPFPTNYPTPYPTPCVRFACPPNSEKKVECPSKMKDCECNQDYKVDKKTETCVQCSSFACPQHSTPKKNCVKRFKDCRCDQDYKSSKDACIFCSTFECPVNSKPSKSCVTKFSHCKCDYGFKKKDDACISCSTYTCPINSSPNRGCVTKFSHCKCDDGYKANNNECVER